MLSVCRTRISERTCVRLMQKISQRNFVLSCEASMQRSGMHPHTPVSEIQKKELNRRSFFSSFLRNEEKPNLTIDLTPPEEREKTKKILQVTEKLYEQNHVPLLANREAKYGEPYTNTEELVDINIERHQKPKTFVDKLAHGIVMQLKRLVHLFFRDKYNHHAVVLETVAAVPGMVAGMLRHFASLRKMSRDHGRIGKLLEEAENERMHLLTWMQVTHPTLMERLLVIASQITFTTLYTMMYVVSPQLSHRLVGYLEEEAFEQYTLFLSAIDRGDIPNVPAPEIAKKYWNLKPDATIRDVVLVIRADEAMHRDFNHELATKERLGIKV